MAGVVRTLEIGELRAGVHTFTWDGSKTDGTTVPNGSYNIAITASNGGTQWWRSRCNSLWYRA
ncbi:flagellar hook formation protein FlgD [Salmonella enterica subsp. enterica]|uniref:Flagellar hook formation protein FlgD n=1 Tax=Salmonella enterica I TaxID=59201 RepID=A0A379WVK0_SALET|nr:flagellar hook formation protein FlgD [Salmonella enterica subsp. enterica]